MELYVAVDRGKNRVILAFTDTFSGPPFVAALTHDDISGNYGLAAVLLYAKPPTDGVATVTA